MTLNTDAPAGGSQRRRGLARTEKSDPIGFAVSFLNRLAQNPALDRFGLRKPAEQAVYTATKSGYQTIGAVNRQFSRAGGKGKGKRVPTAARTGVFDLTPSEDEQMLVDVVTELATEVLLPAAGEANDACEAPETVLKAANELGLPILGVAEDLGGIATERSAVAGTLVAEALAKGDMGLAVAVLAPAAVSTALSLWGTDEQQKTYLPAFTEDDVPAAALALAEPRPLFDPRRLETTARRQGDGFVLSGVKAGVPRGHDAELFIVGADLDGKPHLFLVESSTAGLTVENDPSMGVRAAGVSRLILEDVEVGAISLLGDAETYLEAVRLSRLGWCALAVGTAQAVLDYVVPYVNSREAFGEPISHRQAVAFMVANIAIELEGMRLATYKAASRAAQGKDFAREVALAHKLCVDKGMQIGLDGVQLLGGHGYTKEHPVERWYRDLRAIGVMEGGVLV
jgi:alkylation response protein AidB-like acyl-CoA dehydrogenase